MIGNDIVDLSLAQKENNWKRPRFLQKIFTEKEQKYIAESPNADKTVWLLWSMKESAYKLHVQLYGKRFFAPRKFVCSVFNLKEIEADGVVYCSDFQCFTQSKVSDGFVHTIAKLEQNESFLSKVFSIEKANYKLQHLEVHKKAKAQFAAFTETAIRKIRIQKNEAGVPFFYGLKQKERVAVSMSHHGNFGAFAFSKF